MRHFEAVRSHLGSQHELRHNDPYLISFDLQLAQGRHQGIYLAELEDESGRRYLRVSTPIGPLSGTDPNRCLRFNWQQRTGFLAVADLDGAPYLHLCETVPTKSSTTRSSSASSASWARWAISWNRSSPAKAMRSEKSRALEIDWRYGEMSWAPRTIA